MHYTLTQRIWWFIYWLFLIVSFTVIGFLLVAKAMGYRYNPHTMGWQKTGMVIVSVVPRGSLIQIDNQQIIAKTVNRIPNLLPGNYTLRISQDSYLAWERQIEVKSGFVTNLDTVTLLYDPPISVPVSADHERLIAQPITDDRVRIVDNELRYTTDLVSRFIEPPSAAVLLPTDRQIVYLQGKQLRVIEVDGQNDQLLYTRQTDEPSPLVLADDRIVLFKENGQTQALQLY